MLRTNLHIKTKVVHLNPVPNLAMGVLSNRLILHKMNKFILLIIGLHFSFMGMAQFGTGTKDIHFFVHDSVKRNYNIYKPSSYTGLTKTPLVLVLHPGEFYGGDTMNLQIERYTHFDLVADTAGFLICYPNSRKDTSIRHPDWALWDHDNAFGWNDIGFLNQMLDSIIQDYNIDTCRIYMTGFSTGAYISYSMACTSGDRLAAIAPVSGQKSHSYNCNPIAPVPVFHIHGDQDVDALYYGYVSQNLDSVATVLRIWYNYNNCNHKPIITTLPNISTTDSSTITKYYYAPLSSDKEVVHYKVNGGGHGWPGATFKHRSELGQNNMDIDASVEIWDFFRKHRLCDNSIVRVEETANEVNRIFPNPAIHQISIESTISINKINFYSIEGKLLLTTTKNINIDISNFPSGILLIEISHKNGIKTHDKLYKQ